MKTNTVEQGIRLGELGVKISGCKNAYMKNEDGTVFATLKVVHPSNEDHHIIALTLDELHAVFEYLYDNEKKGMHGVSFPSATTNQCKNKKWEIYLFHSGSRYYLDRNYYHTFPRTTNHAADWTNILIWLIENKHVMVEQVNNALEGK